MIRKVLFGLVAMAASTIVLVGPFAVRAELASTEVALGEMSVGKKDAPVTILAFESLTCPHCASFHKGALPKLMKNYIEPGKVRIVFIDYPLGARAMVGSMLARCTGPERYFGMTEIMFKTQADWAGIRGRKEFFDAMRRIARMGGLSDEEFEKCMNNRELFNGIRKQQADAQKKHKINSTPTFVIGDKRIDGAQPFEAFDAVLKPMVEKKQ